MLTRTYFDILRCRDAESDSCDSLLGDGNANAHHWQIWRSRRVVAAESKAILRFVGVELCLAGVGDNGEREPWVVPSEVDVIDVFDDLSA
jgi:hypothetical protein